MFAMYLQVPEDDSQLHEVEGEMSIIPGQAKIARSALAPPRLSHIWRQARAAFAVLCLVGIC